MGKSLEGKYAGLIRYSTDIDLKEILRWLKVQDKKGVEGTFFCNRNLTIDSHNKGELLVYIDLETDKPIAYQWGGLITPGILEVRADKRSRGIGKKLVEYRIMEARKNDKCLLMIQCTPKTSIPFWEVMGFQLYGANNYAFRLLDNKHNLPEHGVACQLKICFYTAERKWRDDTSPIKIFIPSASITSDNVVHLSARVSFFDVRESYHQDTVISIHVDGKQIYLDEAFDQKARALGVKRDGKAFYIDDLDLKKCI